MQVCIISLRMETNESLLWKSLRNASVLKITTGHYL